MSEILLANSVLQRAFERKTPDFTPMRLQKILYFSYSEYLKLSGGELFPMVFSTWEYGPVNQTVYDHFRSYSGTPIRGYGKDALGKSYTISERSDTALSSLLDLVYGATERYSTVELARITQRENSAWWKAYQRELNYLSPEAVLQDETYRAPLGLFQ